MLLSPNPDADASHCLYTGIIHTPCKMQDMHASRPKVGEELLTPYLTPVHERWSVV